MVRFLNSPASLALVASVWFGIALLPGVSAGHLSPRERRIFGPGPVVTPAPTVVVAARAEESLTAVSGCHKHENTVFCMFGAAEYEIAVPATQTGDPPPAYADCHTHDTETFCVDPEGQDVELLGYETAASTEENTGVEHIGENCHFHAGVEHCVGASGEGAVTCTIDDRDYNVPLRIGMVFVMLATGFVGTLLPIFLATTLPPRLHVIFVIVKQFGTGIIIATAFVHLLTHAQLMFANECLGQLKYEATTAAILMAGLFVSFLVEHIGHRVARWKSKEKTTQYDDGLVNVVILESGIIFHSILLGVTVVVAGDSYFGTLFVIIVFHQVFEGIALGSRIASIGQHNRHHHHHHMNRVAPPIEPSPTTLANGNSDGTGALPVVDFSSASSDDVPNPKRPSMPKKLMMAAAYAITTPVGMAIGIGVLNKFNGNDPSTLVALGTLDALSAGILVWVGLVDMLAADWMFGGELEGAGPGVTAASMVALVAGLVLMSVLGKWA